MAYDYDIYDWYLGYLQGANSLRDYCIQINRQEYTYPDNYVKSCRDEKGSRTDRQYISP